MCHYPDLGIASEQSCHKGNLLQPMKSTTQIGVVKHHQHQMSTVILHTSQGLSNNLWSFLKNFMILENARVEFHDFPGFPGLLLIYPNIILIHIINAAILLYCQTKQRTAMSNKHCNFTVILFEQCILFLTLFREENNKIKQLSHLS